MSKGRNAGWKERHTSAHHAHVMYVLRETALLIGYNEPFEVWHIARTIHYRQEEVLRKSVISVNPKLAVALHS